MDNLASSQLHTILIVDDDDMLNELLSCFLQSKGFLTRSACSLSDALNKIKNDFSIDLILLDYQLGAESGVDLLNAMQIDKTIKNTPVIMVSANENPDFLELCFSSGAADYIIKPVNLSLLALKVSALIRSVSLQALISEQNSELAKFKQDAEREETIAKFTYEYLLGQNNEVQDGVSVWLKSSSSFSGDIALVRASPGGDHYFLLADATGHGLSAAITIMPVVSIFNSMVDKGFHIQSIVTEINKKLIRDTPHDRFVAAVAIQIHKFNNEMHVWNGGMPNAYWVDDGNVVKTFKSRHMALGILEDNMFDANVETYSAPESGLLFFCSDGLLEEQNISGECFSSDQVLEIINSNPPDLVVALVDALRKHSGSVTYRDDVSICTITPSELNMGACKIDSGRGLIRSEKEKIANFLWSVKLSGSQLSTVELSPIANRFLQGVGVNQNTCQIVFSVISEMLSNAIDHGVLGLDSTMKEKIDGFYDYYCRREAGLKNLTENDSVELTIEWKNESENSILVISVCDSGNGYAFNCPTRQADELSFGRGLHLIRSLAQSVEIEPPGNRIRVIISSI